MSKSPSSIVFQKDDLVLFSRMSHDVNPLHLDEEYARRTPFGQCVVYGVLGVLVAMRDLLADCPVRLTRLAVDFRQPLFVDVPYEVTSETPSHGKYRAVVSRAGVPKLQVEIDYEVGGRPAALAKEPPQVNVRREPAAYDPERDAPSFEGEYAADSSLLPALKARFGVRGVHLPAAQLGALLWTSYLVGMHAPGRQALFRSAAIELSRGVDYPPDPKLAFRANVERFDASTATLDVAATLSAGGTDFATIALVAAQRPPPVETSLDDLSASIERSTALTGKLAFVTGSSRGLGAALALGCALQGADLLLHYRRGKSEVEAVANHVRGLGRKAYTIEGDVADAELWSRAREIVSAERRTLDLLVLNAFPPLVTMTLPEITDTILRQYMGTAVGAVAALQTLLPMMPAGATVVHVSSEATRAPPREFAHYVMAKAAVEGLVGAASKEYLGIRFLVVRPPRLHTDMTSSIVAELNGIPTVKVVGPIIRKVTDAAWETNHAVVERFD